MMGVPMITADSGCQVVLETDQNLHGSYHALIRVGGSFASEGFISKSWSKTIV